MIILAEKLAGQNSAYRHQNMKGAFGNEGALRFTVHLIAHRPDEAISGHGWLKVRLFAEKRQNFFHQRFSSDAVLLA
jgi:hypothetical protein